MSGSSAIGLGAVPATRWAELAEQAARAGRDPAAALRLAAEAAGDVPLPGGGATLDRWSALATLAGVDVSVARTWEPHLDALAILAEAGRFDLATAGSTWGVYAAEGAGQRLRAERTGQGWRLRGTKPWCSLAEEVTHALVTAWVDEEQRGLFAVPMRDPAVRGTDGPWSPHGLGNIRSAPVEYDGAAAEPVGEPSWYLRRDGFAWGGIGVAAVWYGAAVGLMRRLQEQAASRRLDQVGELHLGRADVALSCAGAVLADSATAIDAGRANGDAGALLALRVRHAVHEAAEAVLREADHAMGPAPLAHEEAYADRVADLRLYLRQHHAERDAAALGRVVAAARPW
ncbi:acyl-CoA dehydrogenase [Nocardioides sp. BP30]|uniref:acyl-CoA dehydrogenase n=1 Tax=Nocardioides sp. BP30 TaxID=3036374 RepID=UPI0024694678|nr:acyl-CoA dehydrogenase [Nocardioides sp. BP30]WGL51409.1 acyl-CoA dehydrogenase [Nocardioides sp. BP30]